VQVAGERKRFFLVPASWRGAIKKIFCFLQVGGEENGIFFASRRIAGAKTEKFLTLAGLQEQK